MVFKNIFVVCESSEQAEDVIGVAVEMGYRRLGKKEWYRTVLMNINGNVFDYFLKPFNKKDFEELTYIQFMEKYKMSNLKKKIEEAKKVTGLSASALSEKLGFQHKYLTNAVREASTQRQKEIIAKLNGLIFKEENELTHDFEGKALNVNIDDAVMVSKAEYEGLKKEIDHKNQVLDKRNAVLENHINRVNELELQLKTTQQKFIDAVDQKDSEIKKLQNDCKQVVRLNEKVKKQATIHMIIIAILFIASIVGFVS